MVLVRDVVRDVVEEIAPQELPLVQGLSQFDDATVIRHLQRAKTRREPLGFGWPDLIPVVTPVAWLVLERLVERVTDSGIDGAGKGFRKLSRKFRRRRSPSVLPQTTSQQLDQVHRETRELGAKGGLDDETARSLADEVVRRLREVNEKTESSDSGSKKDAHSSLTREGLPDDEQTGEEEPGESSVSR